MITAAPGAGIRVNMKSDAGYSIGAITIPSGTVNGFFVIRGYSSTIGDLDNLGRNADTTLVTTGMPDVTITGLWTPGVFFVLQNLDITGAISGVLIGNTTNDSWSLVSCRVINTQNNAAARTVQGDNAVTLINCDCECTGAAHATVVDCDVQALVLGCRLKGVSTSALLSLDTGTVSQCAFLGTGSNKGVQQLAVQVQQLLITSNTFYNLATCVELPNILPTGSVSLLNNCATDSSKWIDSLYVGTADIAVIECNNRLRDITTARTGIITVTIGEVTTDTGGPETDYVDAAGGNLRLISTSPAVSVGMAPYMDIGAYQRQPSAASGGGGSYAF